MNNDLSYTESHKTVSLREENEDYEHSFENFYYTIESEAFTIVRQEEESHNCFKDTIISELENELQSMKTRFNESLNLLHNRKSAYIKSDLEGIHMRNSSMISFAGHNDSKGELEFFKKELEEAIDLIDAMKEDHAKKTAELINQIKDTQYVLEETLNELSAVKETLESKEINSCHFKNKLQESERIVQLQKEEIVNLKKVIKKKELVECDKLLAEEKSKQTSSKLLELSSKLKLKEEELLRLKEKEKSTVAATPRAKTKRIVHNPEVMSLGCTKPSVNSRFAFKHKTTLEDLLNVDEELEDLQNFQTQPNLIVREPFLPAIKNIFSSPPTDVNRDHTDTSHGNNSELNKEFNEMLNQEDGYLNLMIHSEYKTQITTGPIICKCDSFMIPFQIQDVASKRLSTLEHLQIVSSTKNAYLTSLYPLQTESMNSLIEYLKRDLETLKTENHLLKINYENKIIEMEESYLTKLRGTRSHKSVCTTRSTK